MIKNGTPNQYQRPGVIWHSLCDDDAMMMI
jgi:hypothetical protein